MKQNILIGGAWPYANNSLHLGHLAGLISGDVLARYHRVKGDDVLYVSGTDCHGTPITERAKQEGKSAREIAEYYHNEFVETFNKIHFSYDVYSETMSDYHKEKCKEIFVKLYDNGYIYEKVEPQAYCETCNKFLQDREMQITCPECNEITKADQCGNCSYTPTVEESKSGDCLECGKATIEKDNKNLYLALSKFQKEIEANTDKYKNTWRINARNETEKYLKQGLKDRAVTRDIDWGVEVPIPGYENKRMYVWVEAVLGYLTDTMKICEENGTSWRDYWENGDNKKIYMSHGKDNIVFHSIIFNGLLLGLEDNIKMVDTIVSTEYLNINDEKISKSKGNGITTLEMLDKYNPDSLRYHIINNGPERKDTNFTLDDFEKTHNTEILNKFGNLINRTLKFKGLEEIVKANLDKEVEKETEEAYKEVAKHIESLEFKAATDRIMNLVEFGNKYYDEKQPWIQKKEDEDAFNTTIYNCTYIIANLSNLFEPFMPASCKKIREYLGLGEAKWVVADIEGNVKLEGIEPLFSRI
ncbi:MAG: methionine--tRNA ligase [Oscillospiraceae bacterium]|nr:methionine--tRNA ligase [Oscillospiraceae bacterium]